MSELTLTLARFAFLGLLWLFVVFALIALRNDLRSDSVSSDDLASGPGRAPRARTVGARAALLVVLGSCYPKVQHSIRDGVVRLHARAGGAARVSM